MYLVDHPTQLICILDVFCRENTKDTAGPAPPLSMKRHCLPVGNIRGQPLVTMITMMTNITIFSLTTRPARHPGARSWRNFGNGWFWSVGVILGRQILFFMSTSLQPVKRELRANLPNVVQQQWLLEKIHHCWWHALPPELHRLQNDFTNSRIWD